MDAESVEEQQPQQQQAYLDMQVYFVLPHPVIIIFRNCRSNETIRQFKRYLASFIRGHGHRGHLRLVLVYDDLVRQNHETLGSFHNDQNLMYAYINP